MQKRRVCETVIRDSRGLEWTARYPDIGLSLGGPGESPGWSVGFTNQQTGETLEGRILESGGATEEELRRALSRALAKKQARGVDG